MSFHSAAAWAWSKFESIHSEPGTQFLSWGRVASTIALVSVVAWGCVLVWHTHQMPSLVEGTGFITAPYLANKTATAIQAYSNNPVNK